MGLGAITCTPEPANIGPNSMDLRLGDKLFMYSRYELDASRPAPDLAEVRAAERGWLLLPGRLYLGATLERVCARGFVPWLDGRSSLGRLGVSAHITAGRGDNGFDGNWTLEISVVQPVWLQPHGRYFQMSFFTIEGEPEVYAGRYQSSTGVVGSRMSSEPSGSEAKPSA